MTNNRMKIFADDSIAAMAKITRELGEDARIYSTRQVQGGIEIVAGPPEESSDEARPARLRKPTATRKQDFISMLENIQKLKRDDPARAEPPREEPAARAEKRAKPDPTEVRLRALEKCIAELKAMMGSDLMAKGLRQAGASPELVSMFLAQSGAFDAPDADRRFAAFLASRMLPKKGRGLLVTPRTFVMLGPSGSGKTTLLAQLAAKLRMNDPEARFAFVNADSNRLGASEQLRGYGRILDVPVAEIEHIHRLADDGETADRDLTMLVDMPSNMEECARALAALEKRQGQLAPLMRIGVIAANLAPEAARGLIARYPALDALALTKLDEAQPSLATFGALALQSIPLACLATSAHMTRGLEETSQEQLEHLILGAIPGRQK